MHFALGGLLAVACAAPLFAQAAQPQAPQAQALPQQPAGLETPWEIAPVLGEIGSHATRLGQALDKVDVNSWVQKGASDTYAAQLQSSKEQARAVADEAKALALSPEKLAPSLQLFFRIQALETMLGSLEEGLRKYQGPADAQQLAGLEAENGRNRDRFQNYIVNLAAQREQEMKVMDREAQRCRGLLTAPSSPTKASGRKR